MEIHRGLVDLLLSKPKTHLDVLIGEEGLGIVRLNNNIASISIENVHKLYQIFYTLDFLQRNNLIKVGLQRPDRKLEVKGSTDSYGEAKFTKQEYEKWSKDISIELALFEFKKNGYQTSEQKKEKDRFRLKIISFAVAIIAAILSGLLAV